ncbi:hypothetical protein AAHB52_20915 [Bacillus toyonensis]
MGNYLKTSLYQLVYKNTDNFMGIFDKYNYPNVGANLSPSFYNEMINCIESTKVLDNIDLQRKEDLIEMFKYGRGKVPIF